MRRDLLRRIEAMETGAGLRQDNVPVIFISNSGRSDDDVMGVGDGGHGGLVLAREPGELLPDFKERCRRTLPRPAAYMMMYRGSAVSNAAGQRPW